MSRALVVGLAGALAAGATQAQFVEIVGAGATTCAEFLWGHERNPLDELECFAWAQGYMRDILVRTLPGTDDNLNLQTPNLSVRAKMSVGRAYCGRNLRSDYSDAVEALYRYSGGVSTK